MGVDFDVAEFCRKLRQSEGPYKCPIESCGKVYQSVVGMNYHLLKFDHNNPLSNEDLGPVAGGVPSVKTPLQKASTPKPRSSIKSGMNVSSSHTLLYFFHARLNFSLCTCIIYYDVVV